MKSLKLEEMIDKVLTDDTFGACLRMKVRGTMETVLAVDGVLRGYERVARLLLKKNYLLADVTKGFTAFVNDIEERAKDGRSIPYFNYVEELSEMIEGCINGMGCYYDAA